jgi:cytochrome c
MEDYLVELVLSEPKRCVDEAIAFCRATAKEIALAEFSNPYGRFAEGEHYVYVLDISGMMLAHPVNEDFVGKDFYRVQDPEGRSFVKEIVDTANNNGGSGWVEYKWFDPVTKTEQPKTVYYEKFDNMIFCSGIYRGIPALDTLEYALAEAAVHETPTERASAAGTPAFEEHRDEQVEEDPIELVPDDAKRWVEKAIAFCRANGKGTALVEFSSPHGRLVRDSQYVYVLDTSGMMLAHPVNGDFVGKDFYRVQDPEGRSFVKEIVDTANNNGGSGWVEYKWFDPARKMVENKTVYFEKYDNMIFCSGIYW